MGGNQPMPFQPSNPYWQPPPMAMPQFNQSLLQYAPPPVAQAPVEQPSIYNPNGFNLAVGMDNTGGT